MRVSIYVILCRPVIKLYEAYFNGFCFFVPSTQTNEINIEITHDSVNIDLFTLKRKMISGNSI